MTGSAMAPIQARAITQNITETVVDSYRAAPRIMHFKYLNVSFRSTERQTPITALKRTTSADFSIMS